MKRYISAVLIPSILLQLCGCYTTREIEVAEIQCCENFIIITQDSTVYNLNRKIYENNILQNPNEYFSDNWVIYLNKGVINLVTQKAVKNNLFKEYQIINDTTTIMFQDIKNISTEYVNAALTILLGIGVIIIGLAFLVVIFWENLDWKLPLVE